MRVLPSLVLLLLPLAGAAAQAPRVSLTPYLGVYAPTADASRLGDGTSLRHQASLAAGARVAVSLGRRLAVEFTAEYAPSDLHIHNDSTGQLERVGFDEVVDAHVLSGAARLSWAVIASRDGPGPDVRVSAGLGLVDHGGSAYEARVHRTRFGGVIGASAGFRVMRRLQVRASVEDYVYRSDLTPFAFPLGRLDASVIPLQAPSEFQRTQHDLHVALGMTIW